MWCSCSFCGNACGDYACNTLEKIAKKYNLTHDKLYGYLLKEYKNFNNFYGLKFSHLRKILKVIKKYKI